MRIVKWQRAPNSASYLTSIAQREKHQVQHHSESNYELKSVLSDGDRTPRNRLTDLGRARRQLRLEPPISVRP